MASVNLSLPKLTMDELQDDAKLQKILSYLYTLNEQLRYELTHIDDDNISGEGISAENIGGTINRTITNDQGEALKLYASARKMLLELSAKVDESNGDIAAVAERVAQVEVNAEHIETEISYIQEAQDATDENVKTLTEQVTTVEQTASGLETTITEVKSQVSDVDGSVTQLEERMLTVEESAEGLKVEVSSKVTQGEVDASIDAIDEFHNTAVDITADGIKMNTTGSIRAIVDDVERLTIDETGVNAPLIMADEVHAGNLVEMHLSASAEWKGGIQKSLDALPKYLTQDTTLTVPAGTYAENVAIKGFVGAGLTLKLSSGVNINGRVSISDCSRIGVEASTLGDAAIYPRSGGTYTIDINSCQYVLLNKLYISGYRGRTSTSDGTDRGVEVFRSNVRMQNCCIEYTDNYAYYQELGTFFIYSAIGGSEGSDATTNANLGYSVRALNGAHGGMYLAVPMSVSGYGSSAATLLPVSVTPTAGGMTYTEPEYVTQTFTISKHCTYLYGEKRIRDDQATVFSQGYYGTYTSGNNNWRIGAMWFADAASALAGKTIKSAKLTIRRASGGWSNAVGVYLGTVALAESNFASTLTPTFNKASTYPIASLARETEATYDVTALMSAIQAGQAIGVFEPRSEFSGNFSPAYTNFYGLGSGYEPVLAVEYK